MTTRSSQSSVFPTTQRTWIGRQLEEGDSGFAIANHHVMDLYAAPLRVYLLGSTFRWLGDADDIVAGFFASRLARRQFLGRWLASGRPLRYWLIVGFKHYLFEHARSEKRRRSDHALPDQLDNVELNPEALFHRESALAMVREAMRRAQESCQSSGLDEHWRLFVRHHLEGAEYASLCDEFGVDRARAAVMARTAANRFKSALRELVAWEGATPAQIDADIQSLMEASSS